MLDMSRKICKFVIRKEILRIVDGQQMILINLVFTNNGSTLPSYVNTI